MNVTVVANRTKILCLDINCFLSASLDDKLHDEQCCLRQSTYVVYHIIVWKSSQQTPSASSPLCNHLRHSKHILLFT